MANSNLTTAVNISESEKKSRIVSKGEFTPPLPSEYHFHILEGEKFPMNKKGEIIEEPQTLIVKMQSMTVSKALEGFNSLKPSSTSQLNDKTNVYSVGFLGNDKTILFEIVPIEGSYQFTIVPRYSKLPRNMEITLLRQRHASLVWTVLTDALGTIERNSLPIHYRVAASAILSPEFQENVKRVSEEYDSVLINEPLSASQYWKHPVFVLLDMANLYGIRGEKQKQIQMINMVPTVLSKFADKILPALRTEGIFLESVLDLINYFQDQYMEYKLIKGSQNDLIIHNKAEILGQLQDTINSTPKLAEAVTTPTKEKAQYPLWMSFVEFVTYLDEGLKTDDQFMSKTLTILSNASEGAPYTRPTLLRLTRDAHQLKPDFFETIPLEELSNKTQAELATLLISAAGDELKEDVVEEITPNYNDLEDEDSEDYLEEEETNNPQTVDIDSTEISEDEEITTIEVPVPEIETVPTEDPQQENESAPLGDIPEVVENPETTDATKAVTPTRRNNGGNKK